MLNRTDRDYLSEEKKTMANNQTLYKNGCWGCLRASEDPQEKYICPKIEQHLIDYENQQRKFSGE